MSEKTVKKTAETEKVTAKATEAEKAEAKKAEEAESEEVKAEKVEEAEAEKAEETKDEATEDVSSDEEEKEETEETGKTTSGVKKFFIWALVIVLTLMAGTSVNCWIQATRNPLPNIPVKITAEEDLYNNIAKGIIVTGSTSFSTKDLNGALEIARTAANKALKEGNVKFDIKHLYGELKDSELICYMIAEKGKSIYNFTINAEVDYTAPDAKIYVSQIKLGNLKLPVKWIMKKVAKYPMPDNITVEGRRFIYNTSSLNDLLLETAHKNQTVKNVENTIGGILSVFGVEFGLDDVIDFKIKDIYIRDSKLTIKSDLFKK